MPRTWTTRKSAKTKKRLEEQGFGEDILTIKLQNFCTIDEIAREAGGFDFMLADLGVSSMQIDNPKTGLFLQGGRPSGPSPGSAKAASARRSGFAPFPGMNWPECSMRTLTSPTARSWPKPSPTRSGKAIRMDTTTALREVIEKTLDFLPEKEKKETIKKTCQRTFQALRIDVNREFEVLYEFMEKLPDALRPGRKSSDSYLPFR